MGMRVLLLAIVLRHVQATELTSSPFFLSLSLSPLPHCITGGRWVGN